ncbi:MAG: hypothetical protein GY795_08195 [Desulfobacterales bacterium]|nr:hypothetical protein [Desulfobacterales bacterium]
MLIISGAAIFLFIQGCRTHHEIEVAPIEVKPIHITIDVNVKVDKALDDFFNDIDKVEEKIDTKPSVKK